MSPRRLPALGIALTTVLARAPFSALERVGFELTRGRRGTMPAPVFVVGYWRSGTTHLHNLLGKAERFGYLSPLAAGLPWDLLGLVRVFGPLLEKALPEDRYIDRVAVAPDSPQEDSIALASMVPVSYYHGLYFPRHFERHFRRGVYLEGVGERELAAWARGLAHLLEKAWLAQGRRRLVIKNPVYTGQVARLRAIWPHAQFVHIHRDPFVVFRSTRHFFRTLLGELSLQGVDPDALPIDALILESYPRLTEALYADAAEVPPGHFAELRFEDLEREPIATLERLFETLRWADFAAERPRFEAYLDAIAGYRKNRYPEDPQTVALVEAHWSDLLRRWGYARPPG